ncbi:MAG: N-acetylglucosamine-6-phosphate deacetylase [Candidatus Theseobacter exili]|nr:N-acetylglucosamine-6-phosphate deacetylase [Candidatus Theseobacter exili]
MFDELLISGAKIVDGRGILNEGVIVVRDGKIASVRQGNICSGTNCLDASGYIIVPGFVDLHLHGDTPDYLPDNPVMCAANEHVKGGTTSFLATFSTSSKEDYSKASVHFKEALENISEGAKPVGVHLEGPFLNPKMAGAQRGDFIKETDIEFFVFLMKEFNNSLKMMTLAPELKGSRNIITELIKNKIVVSAGHSNASFPEAMKNFKSGVSCLTHIFNRMRPFHHRDPGIIGAAFLDKNVYVELIADGFHLDFSVVEIIINIMGVERVIVSSDCVQMLSNEVKDRKVLRTKKGALAGSHLSMGEAFRNIVNIVGVSLTDAVKLTSENPSKLLGMSDSIGFLDDGYEADMVFLDENLNVGKTMIGGRFVFEKTN